jgi:hypothetical protein
LQQDRAEVGVNVNGLGQAFYGLGRWF